MFLCCPVPPKSLQRDNSLLPMTLTQIVRSVTLVAFSSKMKSRVDFGIELVVSFISFSCIFFLDDNKRDTSKKECMRRRNTWDTGKPKQLEPVSSTSRRGARAAYHAEYPLDFGPWIAYTVI